MNQTQRRNITNSAVRILMEVFHDVLQEAWNNNGEAGLAATEVGMRAGLPNNRGTRRIARYLLEQLENEGAVTNDRPGAGRGSWRIT